MSIRRYIKQHVGHVVQCHTHFGTFRGVLVHCGKHHVVLAVHTPFRGYEYAFDTRQYPMGPGGPGPGPGWGGGGGGWHIAIPLAAILGITAVGMHWW